MWKDGSRERRCGVGLCEWKIVWIMSSEGVVGTAATECYAMTTLYEKGRLDFAITAQTHSNLNLRVLTYNLQIFDRNT